MNFASSDIFSGDHGGSQVSSVSTSSTPGSAEVTSLICCSIIGPTGQPIDVRVKSTCTLGPSIVTSYISPRSTMSIPSSGSSTCRRASTTSSRLAVSLMRPRLPLETRQPNLFPALALEEVDALDEADPVAADAHHERVRPGAVGAEADAAQ